MFLSIIIPVYNVRGFLEQCIDSIIESQLSDYEIILINDGSNDGSDIICIEYEKKYSMIRFINQKNMGLSTARNEGLRIAKGEYVTFIDSDDYVQSKNFKLTIDELRANEKREIQVVISDYNMVSVNNRLIKSVNQIDNKFNEEASKLDITMFLNKPGCFWNTWRYIFKRDFLIKNNLLFKDGYLCEDIDHTIRVYIEMINILFNKKSYYCYRVRRDNSIMSKVTLKRISDYLEITEDSIYKLQNKPYKNYFPKIQDKLIIEYLLNLATMYEVEKEAQEQAKILFENYKYILKYSDSKHIKVIKVIIEKFGISPVAFILYKLKKMRRSYFNGKKIFKEK